MAMITVLGGGRVGGAIARDLAVNHKVMLVDKDSQPLDRLRDYANLSVLQANLSDPDALSRAVHDAQWVVGAVPGYMGFAVFKQVIELGKNCVDISFFPEDGLSLDSLAKERGVCAVFDMGVAPGLDHLLLGYHRARGPVKSFRCLVGGLPEQRTWPFYYKAPFSPVDVLQEYTRPARMRQKGQDVVIPALSDTEYVEFEGIGTLEAFASDGLRSLLHTMPDVESLCEKTLRYPGHVEVIKMLRAAGFFSEEVIPVGDCRVSPMQITEQVLAQQWGFAESEADFTVMRVEIERAVGGVVRYTMADRFDHENKILSMARTTGFSCTAALNAMIDGIFQGAGVFAPEHLGAQDDIYHYMMAYLNNREVYLHRHDADT